MRSGLITLTTDFGVDDVFVGVMKGVIARVNPSARVVDLTHAIPPFDLLQAAVKLAESYTYFPEGTVHVAVVDPGVGGDRKTVCVEAAGHVFLAPDNGILSAVTSSSAPTAMFEVTNHRLFLAPLSGTFHGRDIFAPVAARLAAGLPVAELGPPLQTIQRLDIPKARIAANSSMHGQVLWADRFGNLITSLRVADIMAHFSDRPVAVQIAHASLRGIANTFSHAAKGAPLAYAGSFGALEIGVREGNAAQTFGAERGTPVIVSA